MYGATDFEVEKLCQAASGNANLFGQIDQDQIFFEPGFQNAKRFGNRPMNRDERRDFARFDDISRSQEVGVSSAGRRPHVRWTEGVVASRII